MKILAIENSGPCGSVALVNTDAIIRAKSFANPRGRGSGLFETLAEMVRPDVKFDIVLVGTGPGSYNGLRSSIAAGWGVARARGIKFAGVCSLLGYDASDYFVVGDARAAQWFVARVTSGKLINGPELLSPPDVLRTLVPAIPVFSTTRLPELESAIVQCPRAEILARYPEIAGKAEPIYLKPPHITVSRSSG